MHLSASLCTIPKLRLLGAITCAVIAPVAFAQHVTFPPYLQLGDNGPFGPSDQIVIAWQADEAPPRLLSTRLSSARMKMTIAVPCSPQHV